MEKGERLRPDLTQEQKKDVAEAFHVLDMDGTNTITPADLKVALRGLGYEPNNETMRRVVLEMDRGGLSNNFVLAEFENIMRDKFFSDATEEELRLAFPLFTEGKSDYITIDDLRRISAEVGEGISDKVLQDIIKDMDSIDRDGRISREEFMRLLLPPPQSPSK